MKQSSHMTGVVQDMILTFEHEGGEATAAVGSAAWFQWLEQATSFTFRDAAGHFTAQKTQAGNRRGGAYWRATRRLHGRLASYYLGPSARLTPERLRQAAQVLSGCGADAFLEQQATSRIPHHPLTQPTRAMPGRSLAPPSPLPRPLTRLLGRSSERAQVVALLRHPAVRLLTLTGPGGVGKTRLALEAVHDLVPDFVDGVYFVDLAAISDPNFVLPAITQALGLREMNARSPLEGLQAALADRCVLLLLDNFEQVLAAAPLIADVLGACPHLHLLVTSRVPLRLHGEHEFSVSPLSLPDLSHLPTSAGLEEYASCALFVERAQAIRPEFQVTAQTARAIAELCTRLDGLPLAIELAAARIRFLSPQALLARLEHRLDVLTAGARNLPSRQQTLRSTIAWSYNLLESQEQRLFRWLAVFVGGCTLSAVEAIAQQAGVATSSILDGVSMLLENHLLRQVEQPDGEPRLLMLQTIREFGLECLERCGELEEARAAHAAYYLALAEEAAPQLRGAEQTRWVAQLECEQENLRAVLSFLLEQAGLPEEERKIEWALRLCVALQWFWEVRGSGREALNFLLQALAKQTSVKAALRAKALYAAADLAFVCARNLPLEQLAEESLALYQQLGEPVGIACSLWLLGAIARIRSQFALAHARLEEAVTRFQQLGNRWRQGQCSTERARAATEQGQYERAWALLSESLALYQSLDDQMGLGWVRYLQARLLFVSQQDRTRARQLTEQSLAHFRKLDSAFYSAQPLGLLGLIHLEYGELEAARPLLEESLALGKQVGVETEDVHLANGLARLLALDGDAIAARRLYQESLTLLFKYNVYKESLAASLEGLAALEAGQGKSLQALWLWGAAETLREAIDAPMHPVYRTSYEQAIARVRAQLGEQAFRAAWAEGRLMTPQQALAAQEQALPPPALKASPFPAGLTAREVEVLRLLAQGWTDAQIAEHLVISVRTVNRHTTSLYSKLGVSSRAAATRAAIEHHLL